MSALKQGGLGAFASRRVTWVVGLLLAGSLLTAGALIVSGAERPAGTPIARATGRHGLLALPVAARGAVSRGLGGDDRSFWAHSEGGGVRFVNRSQGLDVSLSSGGLRVAGAAGARFGLSGVELGRGRRLSPVAGPTGASVDRNRVVFSAGAVREWFANGPLGLEQGFTIRRRPAGTGRLVISQAISAGPSPGSRRAMRARASVPVGRASATGTWLSPTRTDGMCRRACRWPSGVWRSW